jgi:hypothetical protein
MAVEGGSRMKELKRRIIEKDKENIKTYFNQAKRLIRKNKQQETIATIETLLFIEQVQDYILEEAD